MRKLGDNVVVRWVHNVPLHPGPYVQLYVYGHVPERSISPNAISSTTPRALGTSGNVSFQFFVPSVDINSVACSRAGNHPAAWMDLLPRLLH